MVAGLVVGSAAGAAAYAVHSQVDANRLGVEDQVQLTITVQGSDAPDPSGIPALTNLVVVGGPTQSTQVSIVNGQMTQSRSWTYVLQPQGEGSAEIGPVTAGTETAPAIVLEVAPGRLLNRDPSRGSDPFGLDPFADAFGRRRPQQRTQRRSEPKVRVLVSVSRRNLRVGESLLLTYNLYTQVGVSDLNFKEAPQFTGFWAEELEQPKNRPSGEAATLDGESYRRFPILRKLLFPTRAGPLEIPPATFRIGLASRGFFDRGGAVERSTSPVTVTVEPLPDVPGFSGAVGRFDASATLDRDTLPLGDAAVLRLRVEGSGNLKWIDRPPDVAVPGAKVYPPQVKSNLRVTPQGIRGSRTWEFVVVPETGGSLEVPSVAFLYFDPKAQKVVAAETQPLPLRVEGGTVAPGAPIAPAVPLRAGGALPLRADLDPPLLALPSLGGRTVAILASLVLLGHVGLWGTGLLRGAFRSVGGRTTPVRSVRAALKDIQQAGQAGMRKEQAAALLEKGLHEAFGDVADDDGSDRAQAVRALLAEVHFVRYAPQLGDYSETLGALAARAAEAVKRWA